MILSLTGQPRESRGRSGQPQRPQSAATRRRPVVHAGPVEGTAIVGVFGTAAGMTGLSLTAARRCGFCRGRRLRSAGHHVGYYPGAEQMILKLVYDA